MAVCTPQRKGNKVAHHTSNESEISKSWRTLAPAATDAVMLSAGGTPLGDGCEGGLSRTGVANSVCAISHSCVGLTRHCTIATLITVFC